MSQNTKRSIHCSFCDDEGHMISNCQDPRIEVVVKDFEERIALDMKCKFKKKYVKHIMDSLYTISDIRILGYQKGVTMNKSSKDEFTEEVVDEYYDIQNNYYTELFNGLNDIELAHFANDIAKSSKSWCSRKISLQKTKEMLGIHSDNSLSCTPTKRDKTVSSTTTTTTTIVNESVEQNDEETHNHDFQYFLLPLVDEKMFNELSPALKNGLDYMYFLSIAAVILNLYVMYTS